MSLSARRAWIEMMYHNTIFLTIHLESLSARRAWIEILRQLQSALCRRVALRKESVDRNTLFLLSRLVVGWSLSARRAWIEMLVSVSTNFARQSLSARRAWIEIHVRCFCPAGCWRSLSARRAWIEIAMTSQISVSTVGRSPQGERG